MASGSASETLTTTATRRARVASASSNATRATSSIPTSRTSPGPMVSSNASPPRAGRESQAKFPAKRSKKSQLFNQFIDSFASINVQNKHFLYRNIFTSKRYQMKNAEARSGTSSEIQGWKRRSGRRLCSGFRFLSICWDRSGSSEDDLGTLRGLLLTNRELK